MSNVKYLDTAREAPVRASRPLPRPLRMAADQAGERLQKSLVAMLDGADDRLFDLAQGATDAEQTRYFDAMRALRLGRGELTSRFRKELQGAFAALIQGGPESSVSDRVVDIDSLTLVEDKDMEIGVAVENMARRARETCVEDLQAFNHRLEYLLEGQTPVGENNSPLDPARIAEAFRAGLEGMEMDIHVTLVVFKLFERMVLADTATVVLEANRSLVGAGVLPDMKTAPKKTARARPTPTRPDTDHATVEHATARQTAAADAGTGALFTQLRSLLAGMSGGVPAMPAMSSGAFDTGGVLPVIRDGQAWLGNTPLSSGPVKPVSSADLVGLLHRLQRLERQSGEVDEPVNHRLAELMAADDDGETRRAVSDVDSDVINLVSMLFDFILDDQSLASEIKALIGRLQIPFLKVAISDETFFAREDHPARQLLDGLARIGAHWSTRLGEDDSIFVHVRRAVLRVLDDFENDDSLFDELLGDLERFEDEHQRRTDRLEHRLREVEEGRLRALAAREAVDQLIDKRLAGRRLPDHVLPLLQEAWHQVLYLTHLREGEESDAWRRRARLTDALIWSILPHADKEALQRLSELSPKLQKGLHAGFEAVGYDAVEAGRLLVGLNDLHQRMLMGLDENRSTLPAAADVAEQGSAEQAPEIAALEDDHPAVKPLRALASGQWFDLPGRGESAAEPERCRLAANIRQGTKLVFVNARGIKVAEYSANQLAGLLEQGSARQVEDSRLFDRALEAMIADLRRTRSATVQP